ncbi:MAG: hypothetical protein L6R37_008151 [Teloschistes peruensis]|nr:MAG: hypothetical protein L6R37_008151 [Teloschistes peruensis]
MTQSEQNGVNGTHTSPSKAPNSWSSPGTAAFDFRSDVVTTPTPSMLTSIQSCTLLDDVFAEDPTTQSLESHIASLTGHPAALLVLSGTMGNQLAIRTHLTQPPHSVLADSRSHIYQWEAGGIASLSGAFPIQVVPANGHHITLEDVKKHAVLDDNVHHCPTTLISLENTLNGTILPLSTCQSISTWARAQSPPLKIHLDGARIWEAVAAGAGSLKEYCECFDSVSLCFSKGLGAPIGSIIVGSKPFIARARHIRKALGGGLRQSGVIAAPARVAVDETFLGGKLGESHERAKEVERMWEGRGGRVEFGVETNMVWFDLEAAEVGVEGFVEAGVREGVKLMGGRVVVHYQIGEEGVRRLGRVMDRVLGVGKKEAVDVNGKEEEEGVKKVAREISELEVE